MGLMNRGRLLVNKKVEQPQMPSIPRFTFQDQKTIFSPGAWFEYSGSPHPVRHRLLPCRLLRCPWMWRMRQQILGLECGNMEIRSKFLWPESMWKMMMNHEVRCKVSESNFIIILFAFKASDTLNMISCGFQYQMALKLGDLDMK